MPEFLYVICGLSNINPGMSDISVKRYKIGRETNKRWYILDGGNERWVSKGNCWHFFSVKEVTLALRKIKAQRLFDAKLLVNELEETNHIRVREQPYEPDAVDGPIQF